MTVITGRTVLLKSGSERVCATILPAPSKISYAIVNGLVAGEIHVFLLGNRYALLSDLFNTHKTEVYNNAM